MALEFVAEPPGQSLGTYARNKWINARKEIQGRPGEWANLTPLLKVGNEDAARRHMACRLRRDGFEVRSLNDPCGLFARWPREVK